MMERIIIMICCVMCSVPFLIISIYNKDDGLTPIVFWSGSEERLKKEIKDIKSYNRQMAGLYKKGACAFLVCGVSGMALPIAGYVLLGVICTVGIYGFYKGYKRIYNKNI